MLHRFSREELLIGSDSLNKLQSSHVAVFGVGGVGGYAVEALARGGVGAITVVDGDKVSLTNINRQIIALESTLNMPKVQAAAQRIKDIDPECAVTAIEEYFTRENADGFDFSKYDYVVDAVDTVTSKLIIIEKARAAGVPVISCMGTGNKLDPMGFKTADIYETKMCPLARIMRKELKKRGIENVKVVYSEEDPESPAETEESEHKGRDARPVPASISFVPAAAGLLLAAEVIKEIIKQGGQ